MCLTEAGYKVCVVDNLSINHMAEHFENPIYRDYLLARMALIKASGAMYYQEDAKEFTGLLRAFDRFKPTKVVHLAAISSAVKAKTNPGLMFDSQLVSLKNTLELARMDSTINQVLLFSSSTVYGDFDGEEVNEDTRPHPRGIYANTKYMGERLVRAYNSQHGLGTTIVRPSALYGERCVSGRVTQAFIEAALAGRPLRLEGNGTGLLDFTYVSDLVSGVKLALEKHPGRGESQTFNLTYGQARYIKDLIPIIQDICPRLRICATPSDPDKPRRGTLSIGCARDVLGYNPQYPLEVGYEQYCKFVAKTWSANSGEDGIKKVAVKGFSKNWSPFDLRPLL